MLKVQLRLLEAQIKLGGGSASPGAAMPPKTLNAIRKALHPDRLKGVTVAELTVATQMLNAWTEGQGKPAH
jgi:hypothetical protein